jgi:hypothetical protein
MKKFILIALGTFLAIAATLLILAPEPVKEVKILSLVQEYSRIIASPQETLGIVLLMDTKDSFLTDPALIRSARILDETGELAVSMASVESAGDAVAYEGKTFFPFRFNLGFTDLFSTDLSLAFSDANLELTYENDVILSFPIGNIRLTFDPLDTPGHLDLFRLYGMTGWEAGEEILTGFVIGMDSHVESPVVILGISILSEGAKVDFQRVVSLTEAPERTLPVETLFQTEEYSSIRGEMPEETGSLSWPETGLLFVPIVHENEGRYLSRFPVLITYSYLGVEYRHLIDDFLFFAPQTLPEVLLDEVRQITYRY